MFTFLISSDLIFTSTSLNSHAGCEKFSSKAHTKLNLQNNAWAASLQMDGLVDGLMKIQLRDNYTISKRGSIEWINLNPN